MTLSGAAGTPEKCAIHCFLVLPPRSSSGPSDVKRVNNRRSSAPPPPAKEKADTPSSAQAPAEGADQKPSSGDPSTLAVGDDAPALTLKLQDGETVALAELASSGKQVALYFYPKDDTPGCTVEATAIRDEFEALQEAGVEVFGVSMQDAESHKAFIEKHDLPFSLVVDAEGVAQAFGVPVSGGQYAARQTFLIGKDGKIKQVWRKVDPAKHAKELLTAAGEQTAG